MIVWITGNSGSGKSTLAWQMKTYKTIVLDGDEIRGWYKNKDLSKEGRWEHNLATARMAKSLSEQGFDVIVSVICPYKELREQVHEITGCSFIYLGDAQDKGEEYPYEYEEDKYYVRKDELHGAGDALKNLRGLELEAGDIYITNDSIITPDFHWKFNKDDEEKADK